MPTSVDFIPPTTHPVRIAARPRPRVVLPPLVQLRSRATKRLHGYGEIDIGEAVDPNKTYNTHTNDDGTFTVNWRPATPRNVLDSIKAAGYSGMLVGGLGGAAAGLLIGYLVFKGKK